MLKLTRRVGETVRIGESIAVKVLGVKGNQVRLGIEAPGDVLILREEIAGGANLAHANPTWNASELRTELMRIASREMVDHRAGATAFGTDVKERR